ncbi:hypothetical protein BEL05_16605 [Shewanella colwelliana]|nr:DUF58 domain-containing protein [Shewanella colwelliana]OEG75841.1 hypothetical protein BEL05_16605 [Shewanella colwelliana]
MDLNQTTDTVYQRWWKSWLSRRLPPQNRVTLAHKSIFILPTGFGLIWLLLVVLLFLFGTNYQNNLVIALSLLLLSLFNTCIIYSYRNLAGMTLEAKTGPHVYAGQTVLYPVYLSANQVQHQVTLSYGDNETQTVANVTDKAVQTLVPFASQRRGWTHPGRLKVESRYPLGLCRAWSNVDLDNAQIVFATPIASVTQLHQHLQDGTTEQPLRGRSTQGVEEFKGLKPYVFGESLHQIAWKQLAQGRGMLTKEFEQPLSAPTWLTFNDKHPDLELQLSELTWSVDQLSEQEQAFGLVLPNQTYMPATGQHHRLASLKAIATIDHISTKGNLG